MDDEQPYDGGFYNPYDSGFYDSGPTYDKGSPSLNPTAQNKSDSSVQVNPLPTDDQSNQHNPDHIHHHQRPHTHTHRHHHHTHVHDHDHHKHHHHHEHPPPEQEPPPHIHEQPPHVHEHHHHIHDQQVHVHDHPTHVHEHSHHQHKHHHHQHHHHEHQHISNSPSALTIRRHIPGSTDPSLHNYPPTLSLSPDYMYPPLQPPPPLYHVPPPLYNVPSPLYNVPPPSNLQVTIRRNTPQADHTLIQPIFYPVAVYTNSPAPQTIKEVVKLPPTKPTAPKPRTPIPILPARTSPIPPATPAKPSTISSRLPVRLPPAPSRSPVRLSPSPPPPPRRISPSPLPPPRRISPQPSPLPPQRQSILVRKPVRTDLITPSVHRTIKQGPASSSRSARVVAQQSNNYNQYNRRQTGYSVAKKGVSYRTVPGLTTRELENEEMDDSGAPIYVQTPRVQTVTYRT